MTTSTKKHTLPLLQNIPKKSKNLNIDIAVDQEEVSLALVHRSKSTRNVQVFKVKEKESDLAFFDNLVSLFIKECGNLFDRFSAFVPFLRKILTNVSKSPENEQKNKILEDGPQTLLKPKKNHSDMDKISLYQENGEKKVRKLLQKHSETVQEHESELIDDEVATEDNHLHYFQNNNKDHKSLMSLAEFNVKFSSSFLKSIVECSENVEGNYQAYVSKTFESFSQFRKIDFEEEVDNKYKYILETSLKKKVLFLDMDETLIYSNWNTPTGKGEVISFIHNEETYSFELFIRPWVPEFLKKMNEFFDVYIFTASRKEYANLVVNLLDPAKNLIKKVFYREDCFCLCNKVFIKDLRLFRNISLDQTIIVDNSLYAFANQLSNGILVNSFYGDPNDNEILKVTSYILNYIVSAKNVREVNDDVFGFKSLLKDVHKERINRLKEAI